MKNLGTHLERPVYSTLSTPPTPHNRWWEYVSGGENFVSRVGLYHALADSYSKIKVLNVHSNHRVHMELTNGDKSVTFDFSVFVEDDSREDKKYLPSIVFFAKKKNPPIGKSLEGLWSKYIEDENELEELTRI